ncbi:hypothetical protein GCK72_000697 [Caenorhabditis remanei]|uniref:BAR domain-containing protein n=2 Tax=Caenorhabditis remanei TaxID=31234 RepID=E3M3A2_CAERE|nr:hypothetical protein GCK72_000697 [Caenorhabditis remanei]EFO90777.1 hypothetical protein CRE_08250 [Caenorhabditis remanei]KAF1768884.1 hypothetical protein GCK72_000697 [Caenorhabditis remanei]
MGKSKSGEGNKWLKDRAEFDEEILGLADDASIIFENTGDLLKSMKNFAASVGEAEKKHPYGKASYAAKTYAGGFKNSASSFSRSGDQFDKLYAACATFREHISSVILAKLMSFKDVECKDCDQQMTLLKKAQKDYANKKNKKNPDQVLVDAAEASLKKYLEDAKGTLAKFNKTGSELLTQIAADMKTGFDAYCEAGSNA